MVVQNYHPEEPLKSIFKECYFIQILNESDAHNIPVIDDCCYDFVFFKEAKGVMCYGPKSTILPIRQKVFTVHGLVPPYRIEVEQGLTFFTIKLQPWVNARFFSTIKGKGVVDIENDRLTKFWNKIFLDISIDQRFDLANTYMESQNFELTPSMTLVRELCEYVYTQKGKVTVNELSDQFGRSRQYLGKVFKKEVMYTLKKFIITVRILDLVKYKATHPEISLTELGYLYDYFDQPHFINDFKKVCGVQPMYFFNNLPEFMLRHI